MLAGRDEERARLQTLVDAVAGGRGGALVLRGPAGIGKSALCRHAIEHARTRGVTVVELAGAEPEATLPFAGLADLVRVIDPTMEGVPEPQRAALAGAVGLAEPASADPFLVAAGVLSLLAHAGAGAPHLLVVDDAHWVDPSSVVALLFAARRIAAEAVAMMFAVREPSELTTPGIPQVHVGPLSTVATERLIRAGADAVDDKVVTELARTAGGNPLIALELLASLSPPQRRGTEALTLSVPQGPLEELFVAPVRALDEDTRAALLIAAVCTSDDLNDVSRALGAAGLDLAALTTVEAARLVTLDGQRVRFRHPLVRSGVERSATRTAVRAAHRSAAAAFDDDLDRRVLHLRAAATGVDDDLAASLEAAADRAASRGGLAEAAVGFEHAAELTSAAEARAHRLLRAGEAWRAVGRLDHAADLLGTAARLTDDALLHGQIVSALGGVELWRGRPLDARDILVAEAARTAAEQPALAATLLAGASMPAVMAGDIAGGVDLARRAHATARTTGDGPMIVAAGAMYATTLTLLGDRDTAMPLLDACEAAVAAQPMAVVPPPIVFALTQALQYLDELPRAAAIVERHIAHLRTAGALGLLPLPLATLAEIDFRAGRWARAYGGAAESVALADELGEQTQLGHSLATLATVEAGLGRDTDCLDHAERAEQIAARTGTTSLGIYIARARSLLHAGATRWGDVAAELEPAAVFHTSAGLGQPSAVQWHPDLIESYVRLGRRDAAERLLSALDDAAEATRGVWARGAVARCRGLLADDDDFEAHFIAAASLHDAAGMPFEAARDRLNLGERRRRVRAKASARTALRAAVDAFESLDASAWAERARQELQATGESRDVRRFGTTALTPAELRVALAVAEGATNREVAVALFLSPKTVENHLSRIYTKLQVRSRTALAKALPNL